MVIWITGLSAAGKSTLCTAMRDLLKPRLPELVVLDGDAVREAFGNDLTHCESDRVRQVRRLQGMSRALANQGMVVLVGVLYNHPDLLAWNRENLPGYYEVYLKASLDIVSQRDPKGIYRKAADGEMEDVVGIHIPWHEPQNPDMVVDQAEKNDPQLLARQIAAQHERLRNALPA